MYKELPANFWLPTAEKNAMFDAVADAIRGISPERQTREFFEAVFRLAKHGSLPLTFRDGVDEIEAHQPFAVIHGLPHDRAGIDFAPYDNKNPQQQRWEKQSHVTEAVLLLYAILRDRNLITYRTVNQNAAEMAQHHYVFFHDIFPQENFYDTQSSRTPGIVYWHQDLTGKRHRPLNVPIIGVDVPGDNRIWTVFAQTPDISNRLSPKTIAVLMQERFFTPNDVLVTAGDPSLRSEPPHSVFSPDPKTHDMCYFSKRTRPLRDDDDEAWLAIAQVEEVLSDPSIARGIIFQDGSLLSMNNAEGVHAKFIELLTDPSAATSRHLMKSFEIDKKTPPAELVLEQVARNMYVYDR